MCWLPCSGCPEPLCLIRRYLMPRRWHWYKNNINKSWQLSWHYSVYCCASTCHNRLGKLAKKKTKLWNYLWRGGVTHSTPHIKLCLGGIMSTTNCAWHWQNVLYWKVFLHINSYNLGHFTISGRGLSCIMPKRCYFCKKCLVTKFLVLAICGGQSTHLLWR